MKNAGPRHGTRPVHASVIRQINPKRSSNSLGAGIFAAAINRGLRRWRGLGPDIAGALLDHDVAVAPSAITRCDLAATTTVARDHRATAAATRIAAVATRAATVATSRCATARNTVTGGTTAGYVTARGTATAVATARTVAARIAASAAVPEQAENGVRIAL